MKILIADDHAIVRKGLIQLVNSLPDVDHIDEAEDGKPKSYGYATYNGVTLRIEDMLE